MQNQLSSAARHASVVHREDLFITLRSYFLQTIYIILIYNIYFSKYTLVFFSKDQLVCISNYK